MPSKIVFIGLGNYKKKHTHTNDICSDQSARMNVPKIVFGEGDAKKYVEQFNIDAMDMVWNETEASEINQLEAK